ncbi:MAG: carbamoyl-phosphate synthase large subunit, partial [Nitrospirota bacterium]|nr:carbamoyl-phosphate synthase large subunit [Nitrospirota bacterium]
MPKRTDIKSILLIGSGPIVIGQACEFDYSGTQACKALKEEGYRVVLINSNPATIMTDPELADRTYVEPITLDVVEQVIERERPDALLPTMGGQTALNTAIGLAKRGTLAKYGVQLIGASAEAIHKAEDREAFRQAMWKIGLNTPESAVARTLLDAERALDRIGFPAIVRPSFTLGGTGGNIAYNIEEFRRCVEWGLQASPVGEILIEQSVIGWKEFELEVMRDLKDNVVIVCPIENLDPMGVHTGDSITVAPAMTLTDKEYQLLRDAALRIIREIGVDTGGSNIQFGLHPETGEMVIIEMNPRVSRSSALASKATGFPIAKIAAKLAVGYTLDEITNDITRVTKAAFEPTIDYVVVKIPRFTFEKFPGADPTLTTQMKSVGEAMAIGRTFKEALQKAVRSMEIDRYGLVSLLGLDRGVPAGANGEELAAKVRDRLKIPHPDRLWHLADAMRLGLPTEELYQRTKIDPWFLEQIREIVRFEDRLRGEALTADLLRKAKQLGFADERIGQLNGMDGKTLRER